MLLDGRVHTVARNGPTKESLRKLTITVESLAWSKSETGSAAQAGPPDRQVSGSPIGV